MATVDTYYVHARAFVRAFERREFLRKSEHCIFFLTTLDEINLKNLTHAGNRLRRAPPMLLDSLRQGSRCLPLTLKGARVTIT